MLALLLVGMLATLTPAKHASAQFRTFRVDTTDDRVDVDPGDGVCDADGGSATICTLRAAIMEANVLGGFQAVELPAGTYRLTRAGTNEDQGRSGDLDITGDINISGVRNTRPIIDADGIDRVFDIRSGVRSAVFGGLTIRGGDATQDRFNQNGGGIRVNDSTTLVISGATITANRARNGGGIHIFAGSLFVSGSRISNNRADAGFGGILSAVNTDISDSTISGNQGELAGGIRVLAFSGGRTVEATIRSSTISGNTGRVGGILADNGSNSQLFVRLINVTISGNSGVRVPGRSDAPVGGIAAQGAAGLSMSNVTIARNSGEVGGLQSDGSVGMNNTLIANNSGGDCSNDRSLNGFTNLLGDLSCRFFVTTGNRRNVDPLLGPLALNGARNGTRTHALLAGSPAIEAGSNQQCIGVDQRTIRRPSGARCDIGAFEKELEVRLGVAALAPATTTFSANTTATLTLSWTVPPTMTWQDLRTVDLQLTHGEAMPVVVRFSQGVTGTDELTATTDLDPRQTFAPTDTLTLFDDGSEAGTGVFGTASIIDGEHAVLDLGQARLQADGPTGQTVTVTLALAFKQPLAGKRLSATLLATDDNGDMQGPQQVGTLAVGPFAHFVPLLARP